MLAFPSPRRKIPVVSAATRYGAPARPSGPTLANIWATLLIATLGACNIEILHDISEPEANQVVAALQRSGLPAQKERVEQGSGATYTVTVRRSDAPRAWGVLRQQNLPRPQEKGLGEVFGDVGLVPTRIQEQALLRHALAGEVARTLNSIDGVRHARVHLVLPQHNPLAPSDSDLPKPRASVLLKVDPTLDLAKADIQQLVAGSVESLDPDSVNVVISRTASPPLSEQPADALVPLGPFIVAQRSRMVLTAILVLAVVTTVGLAIALLLLLRRNRTLAAAASTARGTNSASPSAEAGLRLIEQSITRRPHVR